MKSARSSKTPHFGFLLIAFPLLVAVGPNACPAIDVWCGDVLDIDGGQYRLDHDLVCGDTSTGAAVTITGERVHFNLAGYTITRDDDTGRSLLAGILVRGANAHINGGSIVDINCPDVDPLIERENCSGIFLGEAPGARINGMSLHNNNRGIASFSFDGIFGGVDGNADGARIHSNDITGNLQAGILLSGFGGATAEGARVTGNDLSDTGGFPSGGWCYLGSSDGVSLIGNVASNCAVSGIFLVGNELTGAPERNIIRDNTTLDNGNLGIHLSGRDGFGPRFNVIQSNNTSGNGFVGILLNGADEESRPSFNVIQRNTSFGNGLIDLVESIGLAGPAPDCLNTWKDNDFETAAPDCIE